MGKRKKSINQYKNQKRQSDEGVSGHFEVYYKTQSLRSFFLYFTRQMKAFFGRKHTIKIELKGGNIMDYKIVNKEEYMVLAKIRYFTSENSTEEIPEF